MYTTDQFIFERVPTRNRKMVQKYNSPVSAISNALLMNIWMKYWQVRVYKYPFELLMTAYEMRFPTCEMIPIIKVKRFSWPTMPLFFWTNFLTLLLFQETTIVEEDVSADGSVHMVDRRAKLNVDAPYLLKKMMGVEFLLFRQRNTKDLRARELRIEAWNESFDTRVEINEYCVYR